jgi:hypothetical protein
VPKEPSEMFQTSVIDSPSAECSEVIPLPLSSVFADLLQPGECFVLCDAGGGTVVSSSRSHVLLSSNRLPSHQDVVSYKVTRLEPSLELEEMTYATSLHQPPSR